MDYLHNITYHIPYCALSQYSIIPVPISLFLWVLNEFSNDSYRSFYTFNIHKVGVFGSFDKDVTNNKYLHVANILQCIGIVVLVYCLNDGDDKERETVCEL